MQEPPHNGEQLASTWYESIVGLWAHLGIGVRIGLGVVAAVLVGALIVYALIKLGRAGRRALLIGLTILFGSGTLVLGGWAMRLPEPKGSQFVLTDNLIRLGAACSTALLAACLLGLVLPALLNLVEGRGFVSFVARRHVRSSKSGFLTVISILSIFGVALSSFALCVVVSVMGGFGADLKAKILDNNAHIRIESPEVKGFEYYREILDEVRTLQGVQAATEMASGEGMASSSTNTAGVLLRGVETKTIGEVIDIPQDLQVGSFDYLDAPEKLLHLAEETPIGIGPGGVTYFKGPDLTDETEEVHPGIVLGVELAKSLHAYLGDVITLVSPMGDLGPMGIMPKTRKFRVAGIFDSGMYEYDSSYAYLKLEEAQELLDLGHFVTSVEIRVKDAEAVEGVTQRVREAIQRDDLKVRDWKELNQNLFGALQLEKVMTFVILSIAITVASFCIICTLLLMVTEKSKEIAILKAMGASDGSVLNIFLSEGMFIGGMGTAFGVLTGFVAMASVKYFKVGLDPEVYYIRYLPIQVEWVDYVLVAMCAFVITTLATLYPATSASRLRPVDGIRYE